MSPSAESDPLLPNAAPQRTESPAVYGTANPSTEPAQQPLLSRVATSAAQSFSINGPLAMVTASFLLATMNLGVKALQNPPPLFSSPLPDPPPESDPNQLREPERLHSFEIIFIRSIITYILSAGTMLYYKIDGALIGPQGVRWLLMLRGLEGFLSLSCSYAAVGLLSLGDATVLLFLAPTITGILGALILKEPYSRADLAASSFALVGVICIARPAFLMGHISGSPQHPQNPWGVATAIFGAFFQSSIFLTVRYIRNRAHPLHNPLSLSIVCFVMAGIGYTVAIAVYGPAGVGEGAFAGGDVKVVYHAMRMAVRAAGPEWRWIIPTTPSVWIWMAVVCLSGFFGQIALSRALIVESAARAATLNYSQVVFAFVLEYFIYRTEPNPWSILGAIIIGSSVIALAALKVRHHGSHNSHRTGANAEEHVEQTPTVVLHRS
ncbi:hypothetical protein BJ742DRAFT_755598 [Cladochytrium replicatum]|nr:hypothetical protein BJ742DRAFT_755598 [Cladochytrium replicatum]